MVINTNKVGRFQRLKKRVLRWMTKLDDFIGRQNWNFIDRLTSPLAVYRVVQKKRGHSTFSQISRKLLKISK